MILSAGALNSAQLLMLSGIGPQVKLTLKQCRDEDPDPDPFGPPDQDPLLLSLDLDPDPTFNNGFIKLFSS